MSEPRIKAELREEFKKLKRKYHRVTCCELRDILRRYGDMEISRSISSTLMEMRFQAGSTGFTTSCTAFDGSCIR